MEDGEDSGDEAAFSIAAIKAKYKTGGNKDKKPIYSSDEDDSDVEKKKGKRLQKAKGVDSDSDSNRFVQNISRVYIQELKLTFDFIIFTFKRTKCTLLGQIEVRVM